MNNLSIEEAIKFLEYIPEDISIQGKAITVAKWSMANVMGADALKKLQKIEEVITSMENTDDEVMESFAFREIEKILEEVN